MNTLLIPTRYGIRVNTVCPGVIKTPMSDLVRPEAKAVLIKQHCFPPRFGLPSEFAHLCCSIIENPYLNGTSIRLDAGTRMPKL